MSKRRDHVAEKYYNKHLSGVGSFAASSANTRYGMLERMYIRHLTELACNRFKWINVPDTVDVRYMELQLFRNALAVFYYEFDLHRYLALAATPTGSRDMMDNPTHFRTYGNSYSSKILSVDWCVPIWANYLRIPDLDIVMIYASKLAEIDLTIEINARNARRTKVLVTDEDQALSAKNIDRQLNEGVGTIQLNFDLQNSGMIQALDLGIHPDSIEKMHVVKTRLYNECMGLLGINNANQDKKERLVESEVSANDEQVDTNKNINLNERRAAAKRINDMFGLDIEVMYHTDAEAQTNSRQSGPFVQPMPDDYPYRNEGE